MSRWHQFFLCLAAATAVLGAVAQNSTNPKPAKFSVTSQLPPIPPPVPSPVVLFRQLLVLSSRERDDFLTNRPPATRARILAKVREYQALDPDERELRLRATELRWYLTPLMRTPPVERAERLALVPEALRGLAKNRLQQWDLLPPPVQEELLANDRTLHYFAQVEATNNPTADAAHQKVSEQFNQFFELTTVEKQQTLNTLSEAERVQMEKTLKSFEQLPPPQRQMCIRNYAKFAGMSAAERAEFLKNAERWSQMPPKERQAWRDLVAHVPLWPPVPPPMVPQNLVPPVTPKISRPSMATN